MTGRLSTNNRFADWNFLSFFIFILGCIALLPPFVISAQGAGTDFSYMQALNWIWTHHLPLKYGTDVVYTYGPLGFLCFKVASNWQLCMYIILFEIYVYVNFAIILKAFMPVKSYLSALAILFSLYFFDKQFGEATYFLIFLFSVFTFLSNGNYRYLINALFISVICFFIKVNFGLVQLFLVFLSVFYMLWAGKANRKLLVVIAASAILSLPVLGFILHVNLISYVRVSLDVISGYNETMVLPVSSALKRFQLAFLVLIIYNLSAIFYLFKSGFKPELMLRYVLVSLFVFITYKYAFIRADINRVQHAFFVFVVAAIGIQYLFEAGEYKNRLRELAVISFFMAGTIYFGVNQFVGKPEIQAGLSLELFKDMAGGVKRKFAVSDELKRTRMFPENILKKIGNKPVDLMPYNLSLIFINKLNYCPRPSLQSFSAITPLLDSLNCKKYISKDGPEFVIFGCGSIDKREPFWDESATKRAVCQYYKVVDSFSINDEYNNGYKPTSPWARKYLLMERRAVPLQASVTSPRDGELTLNENFSVDTGLIPQYMNVNFEYSIAGKLKSLLFQPTLVYAVITYANGETDSLEALRPIMQTGVLINKKVKTAEDADVLFETNGAGNEKVKSIKFVTGDNFSFKRKAKYVTELISYTQ